MVPDTTTRVPQHTSAKVNAEIRRTTELNIEKYAANKRLIDIRLKELEQEWDIERTLETNGSILLLLGLALGTFVSKKWYILPALVGSFCLQHALQGWCPPIEIFRRRGIRTAKEIGEERTALKAWRGDFDHLSRKGKAAVRKVVQAVRE